MAEAVFERGRRGRGRVAGRRLGHESGVPVFRGGGLQRCTLLSSSAALAMSLSAMASAFTLKLPSSMAALMRATFSASNPGLLPPETSVAAVLDSSTLALGSGA